MPKKAKSKKTTKPVKTTKKPAKKTSKKTPRNTSALSASSRKAAGPMKDKRASKKTRQKEKTLESALLSSEQEVSMPEMHFDDLDQSEGDHLSVSVDHTYDDEDDEFNL